MDGISLLSSTVAVLGLLLTLLATLLMLLVMPPVEALGWARDRLRGGRPSDRTEDPTGEIEG